MCQNFGWFSPLLWFYQHCTLMAHPDKERTYRKQCKMFLSSIHQVLTYDGQQIRFKWNIQRKMTCLTKDRKLFSDPASAFLFAKGSGVIYKGFFLSKMIIVKNSGSKLKLPSNYLLSLGLLYSKRWDHIKMSSISEWTIADTWYYQRFSY